MTAMKTMKMLREDLKKSMREVALDLGIPYTTYVNYEKGERQPSAETLKLFAAYYDVPVAYLIEEPPFDCWDAIAGHLQAFLEALPFGQHHDAKLRVIWGIDLTKPDDIALYDVIKLIEACVSRITFDGIAFRVDLKDGWVPESPASIGLEPLPAVVMRPRLGRIACGDPILAEENIECEDPVPESIPCDFTLKCEGDSMTGARIYDGDIVYVKMQEEVENGQIAVVRVGDETTLKRWYRKGNTVTLMPENPKYAPMVFVNEQLNEIRVLGRAVAFISRL